MSILFGLRMVSLPKISSALGSGCFLINLELSLIALKYHLTVGDCICLKNWREIESEDSCPYISSMNNATNFGDIPTIYRDGGLGQVTSQEQAVMILLCYSNSYPATQCPLVISIL